MILNQTSGPVFRRKTITNVMVVIKMGPILYLTKSSAILFQYLDLAKNKGTVAWISLTAVKILTKRNENVYVTEKRVYTDLINELSFSYKSTEWRLFIDSSRTSLKTVYC